jgi:DNA-binding winged helix-turn-helix (wHTH) protein
VGTPARTVYRFGPFEADTSSGELLKQGKRVRLQEQPFRLLIVLIEHAGEVVSKAEIQNQIWDGNTFVDFDSSLRVAVGKLREALGDDAGSPHYIESIPKRGYRFLGQVVLPVVAHAEDREEHTPACSEGANARAGLPRRSIRGAANRRRVPNIEAVCVTQRQDENRGCAFGPHQSSGSGERISPVSRGQIAEVQSRCSDRKTPP